jgi:hypothetical protein
MAKSTKTHPAGEHHTAAAHKPAAITLPTLEEDVDMKIMSLKSNSLDSATGREIAKKHILEDVAGGHVDTDLQGAALEKEVTTLLAAHD